MPTGQGRAQPSLRNFSTRPPTTAERFSEHLHAASAALGQSRAGLLRREVRALELSWNLQVRSCQPGPLRADIVHVREYRRNGAGLAGRLGSPGGRVKMIEFKVEGPQGSGLVRSTWIVRRGETSPRLTSCFVK